MPLHGTPFFPQGVGFGTCPVPASTVALNLWNFGGCFGTVFRPRSQRKETNQKAVFLPETNRYIALENRPGPQKETRKYSNYHFSGATVLLLVSGRVSSIKKRTCLNTYWNVLLVVRINGLFHPFKNRL